MSEQADTVEDWIDRNQAARRNITPDDYKILTGRIYNRRKKTKAEAGAKGGSKVQVAPCSNTAESVAAEFETSPDTIKRNGQRAELHDTLKASGDDEAAEAVDTIEAIVRLWELATPVATIASTLHLPQAVILQVIEHGTLPPREARWIQTHLFGDGKDGAE